MIGIIYSITYNGEVIYVGSTRDLHRRKQEHKSVCFNENADRYNKELYKFVRETCKWSELIFEVVKEVEVEDLKELRKIEGEYIRQHKDTSLNQCIAGRTYTEYREQNKERKKEYREQNKEKIKEYRRQYYQQNKEKEKEYQRQNYQNKKSNPVSASQSI